jgi:DNA-binding MarR family transcriptional regulator
MEKVGTTEDLYDLWVLFAMTRDAIFRATKEELSRQGVTPIRSAVMLLINSLGHRATPPEIGRYLLRKRNSVRDLLTRMEGSGLIKKYPVMPKKKLNRYELTEKGHKLYRKTTQLRTIDLIFSSLSKSQRGQLESLLRILFKKAAEELKIKINAPLSVIAG